MPMLPLSLLALHEPQATSLALPLAAASMYPLLERDGQATPCLALTVAAAVLLPLLLPTYAPQGRAAAPQPAPAPSVASTSVAAPCAEVAVAAPRRPMTRLHGRQIAERLKRGEIVSIDDGAQATTSALTAPPPEPRRRVLQSGVSATATSATPVSAAVPAPTASSARNGAASASSAVAETAQSADQTVVGRPWTPGWRLVYSECMLGLAGLLVSRHVVQAPPRLPYLHDALLTAFCFAHFAALWAYVTVVQHRRCAHAEPWAAPS